jgi:hypothetical protein
MSFNQFWLLICFLWSVECTPLLPTTSQAISSTSNTANKSGSNTISLAFYEQPSDTYLTKSSPAILKCKIENARTGFFKCNNEWSQEPINSKIVQVNLELSAFITYAQ